MQTVRLYEIPACKMVSSGIGMFGEEKFDHFDAWFSTQSRGIFPKDFLYFDKNGEKEGFHWLYLVESGMKVPEEFDVIDFPGGLYAVSTDVDGTEDSTERKVAVNAFLAANGLERDVSRAELGHVITSPAAKAVLGFEQMDHWLPVRPKNA